MVRVRVGEIKGQEVYYDEETYEFSVTIGENTFKAKSFPSLKKLVEKSEELQWEKVMEIGYDEATPPKILEVTLRGRNYYVLADGKLHVIDSYRFYRFNQGAFNRLTEISEKIRKLNQAHSEITGKLKRLG